ncbi:hypothetical protein [Cohnella caldifontis]|uniref:hypothetical protein n=1 Tax=Cohnella caldifontis TaxID=3027471 RepID=UPI0023EC5CFA|nr:hypothetical protein [Cohnella sp. YIM B05605]
MDEKTTYEIQFNESFTVRMQTENEPMSPEEFDKAAFEAVLADLVLRAKDESDGGENPEDLWRWVCTQLGTALQNTVFAEEDGQSEQDPLDTLIHAAFKLKGAASEDSGDSEEEETITPVHLLEHLLTYIHQENQIESVLYVARMNDGTITSGWTDLAHTEAIGLLEVGKLQVVKEMWNDWAPR